MYPEVDQLKTDAGYRQRKVVYRNLGNGRFEDVTERLGPPVTTARAARGAAFGDFDNDGDVDVRGQQRARDAGPPAPRLRPVRALARRCGCVGTASNRSAIGARVRLVAGGATRVDEVRGGGSYNSQNDLRVHFGLGAVARVDRLEVRWPNGLEEHWTDVAVDRILHLQGRDGPPRVAASDGARSGCWRRVLLQAAAARPGRGARSAAARTHIARRQAAGRRSTR